MGVQPLRPDINLDSSRRASFVQHLAEMYDMYAAAHGKEPDALALVLGGVGQSYQTAWVAEGSTEGCASSFLAMSGAALMGDALNG